jgi:glycosyltransferase involved in cell wall biosynthesis
MPEGNVAVIIPVYNAAAFLGETLRSALTQSYPATEIIVVDDGSTDHSLQIAHTCARGDSRVQVLQQSQRGPSAARNRGIAESRSDLIAPLDADDLWRPTKLERQVQAMRTGGSRIGLVYTWFALIDDKGRVRSTGHRPMSCGEVFRECCRRNIVGNGSGALMRKSAILECGGYDEHLRGCEDYKLYTAIAERYLFGIVPEHLTGYRQTNHNLTSDIDMIRQSADLVLAELEKRHPEMRREIRQHKRELCHWLLRRGASAQDLGGVLRALRAIWKLGWLYALRSFATLPKDLRDEQLAAKAIADQGSGCKGDGQISPYFLADCQLT